MDFFAVDFFVVDFFAVDFFTVDFFFADALFDDFERALFEAFERADFDARDDLARVDFAEAQRTRVRLLRAERALTAFVQRTGFGLVQPA